MLEPGHEPITGYRLRSRLGAGGYGEVWLCDAPGGLQKAIKFIFGAVTGPQATKELRSLERISKVNHPFLLSIERVEVVGDQLLIVTELAEHSLEDQLAACRKAGRSGLPRRDLLQYMRDAAEALDFLATEHSLQHLDVKPANLLVLSKRIKVADFGLLKDLQAVQQSCIGGMTPAYTAPEVFDGCPDVRSDQYSLAITYIELLTGGLPFSGSTLAALAKQHLNEAPNLDMLPPGDRDIVARAMLKHPLDRFANCRQFIDQLMNVKATLMPVSLDPQTNSETSSEATTTAVTADSNDLFQPVVAVGREFQIADEVAVPTLTIGVGGVGGSALSDLRLRQIDASRSQFLYIDTDLDDIKRYTSNLDEDDPRRIPEDDVLHLRLGTPDEYRRLAPERFKSISRRWLYNVPRSGRTEGIRPLALLSLLHFQDSVARRIQESLVRLQSVANGQTLRVQLLSSLHGATGGGTLAALALLIQDVAEASGVTVEVEALVTAAESSHSGPAKMAPAAALSTLAELSTYFDSQTVHPPLFSVLPQSATRPARASSPLSRVVAAHGGCLGDATDLHRAAEKLADLAEFRLQYPAWNSDSDPNQWFTTAERIKLELPSQHSSTSLAVLCVLRGLAQFRDSLTGKSQPSPEASEQIVQALKGRLYPTLALGGDDAESADTLRRLIEANNVPDGVQEQSALIGEAVEKSHAIVYEALLSNRATWSQVQETLDQVVQELSIASVSPDSTLESLRAFEEYAADDALTAVREKASQRLAALSEAVEEHSQVFRSTGSEYASRVGECGKQIASKIPAKQGRALSASVAESRPLSEMVTIVAEHLQSVLTQSLPISAAAGAIETTQRTVQPLREFNVSGLLSEAVVQIKKLSGRFEITLNDSDAQATSHAAKIVEKLDLAIPPLARCGGKVTRQVAGRSREIVRLKQLIENGGGKHVSKSTSFVHWEHHLCKNSNWILTQATELPLELLVRNLWRPAADTLKLAEKLRSRVDIRWPSIDEMLTRQPDRQDSSESAAQSTDNSAAISPFPPVAVELSQTVVPASQ